MPASSAQWVGSQLVYIHCAQASVAVCNGSRQQQVTVKSPPALAHRPWPTGPGPQALAHRPQCIYLPAAACHGLSQQQQDTKRLKHRSVCSRRVHNRQGQQPLPTGHVALAQVLVLWPWPTALAHWLPPTGPGPQATCNSVRPALSSPVSSWVGCVHSYSSDTLQLPLFAVAPFSCRGAVGFGQVEQQHLLVGALRRLSLCCKLRDVQCRCALYQVAEAVATSCNNMCRCTSCRLLQDMSWSAWVPLCTPLRMSPAQQDDPLFREEVCHAHVVAVVLCCYLSWPVVRVAPGSRMRTIWVPHRTCAACAACCVLVYWQCAAACSDCA
jgi:hypothetical protein